MKPATGLVLSLLTLPAACSPTPTPTSMSDAFKDPFEYCAAVRNADTPDARYIGDKTPDVVVNGLRNALGISAEAPNDMLRRATFWRCLNGKVYACFVGANLPCDTKANVEMKPTQAEADYCRRNPHTDIPAAVTGHETIFQWRCVSGKPSIVKQVFHVDARGYIFEIWYRINPS